MAAPGSLHTLLISKQTDWGTPVNPAKDIGLWVDSNDSTNREIIDIMGGGSIAVQAVRTGAVSTGGDITVQLQHGRLFEFIAGTVGHSTSGSDTRHTFSIADSPPSFTLDSGEKTTNNTELVYDSCLITAAELTYTQGTVLTLKINWAGRIATSNTSSASPVLSSLPTFPQALVDVKLAGVSATMVQNATIRFLKTFNPIHGAKSNLMQIAFVTGFKFEFNCVLGFDDETYQELGIGGSTPPGTSDPTGVEFEINADNAVGFGSGQRNIQCVLENCQFAQTAKAVTVEGITFLTLAGKGTLKTLITVDNIESASW